MSGHYQYKLLFILLVFFTSSCFFKPKEKAVTAPTAVTTHKHEVKKDFKPAAPPAFEAPFNTNKKSWADSVFETLSPDERIAQLFMVAAWSNKGQKHVDEITELVSKYKIGGLIWMQGGPLRQAQLCNYYQSLSKVPLFNAIDGEWGLAMRLDSTVRFPKQMTLGALQNDSLIYEMGSEIARECERIGLQINFAPVVDVNNNPKNPVISNRSFGENKYKVAQKGLAYMKGLQDNHILANAKHFPGHGDTDADSHLTLPVVNQNRDRIDSLELYPFRELFKNGLASLMVAHLYIPALDSTPNRASTLSLNVVTDLLKLEMGFKGLVFTDALNMKGVSKFYLPGEVDWRALLAGNDVLLFAEDVPAAIERIKDRICDSLILHEEIDRRCLKILRAKEWAGLNHYKPVELKNLYEDLNTKKAEAINRQLIEHSITVLTNQNNLIPLKELDTLRIATISVNHDRPNMFQKRTDAYASADHFYLSANASLPDQDSLLKQLSSYNLILFGTFNLTNKPETNFGITPELAHFIDTLCKTKATIVDIFNNAYTLSRIPGLERAVSVIMSYNDNDLTHDLSAQMIFGGISSHGRLPVTASDKFRLGAGLDTDKPIRIKYTIPEELGMSSERLARVDTIIRQALDVKAMPGCQVFAMKDGKVFYQKSFGYHSYDQQQAVKNTDLYDVASVSKITGCLPAIIKMNSEGLLGLDQSLGDHLRLDGTNKKNLKLKEVLAHQAGLPAWIPFWKETVTASGLKPWIYNSAKTDTFNLRVAKDIYINKFYTDSIYKRIYDCRIDEKKKYVYSDLGYYFFKRIIEEKSNLTLDNYMQRNFYKPLGLWKTGYKPLERFTEVSIAPTENDTIWRKQLLRGDVHDQGAAMLGGVGGHAGVFSTANDMGVMMQLYLNGGTYGGKEYFKQEVFNQYNKVQFPENANRRGAGFDKPELDITKDGPTCRGASPLSFGHSGFTGTYVWADPKNGLVYVFLSNRIHPDVENKKLLIYNVRTKVHQVFYDEVE